MPMINDAVERLETSVFFESRLFNKISRRAEDFGIRGPPLLARLRRGSLRAGTPST